MQWKNLPISGKLGIGFGLILALLTITSSFSWYGLLYVNAGIEENLYLAGIKEILLEKEIDHLQWRNDVGEIFTNEQKTAINVQTDEHKCKLGVWLYGQERKDAANKVPGITSILQQLEQAHQEMHQSVLGMQEAIKKSSGNRQLFLPDVSKIFSERTLPALGLVRQQLQGARSEIDKQLTISKESLHGRVGYQKELILLLSIGTLILGSILSIVIARGITGVLRKAIVFAEGVAKGDLSITFEVNRKDELGALASALSTVSANLSRMIGAMNGEVVGLASASNELTSLAERMAGGATVVSDMANSVAAATEEMSSNMRSVAAASEEASTNVGIVASATEEVSSSISAVTEKTREARDITSTAVELAKSSSEKVDALGHAADEISKITGTITEISELTNLLALNATIEAARAGEAGKGFAVVANEIKELAKQTAAATGEIRSSIESIQNSTAETVSEIRQITEVINRVDTIVADIAMSVEEQNATTTEISTNIVQAAQGINEVNGNVAESSTVAATVATDIARVSQTAAELAESGSQVQNSALDISKTTEYLKELSTQFKLNSAHASTGTRNDTTLKVIDLMRWDSSLHLGIHSIDDQHRQLVAMINDLHRAMKQRQTNEVMGGILDRLVSYTVYHFGHEEKLFATHKYPENEGHIKIHQSLIAKVKEFKTKLERGDSTISMELMDFLKDWLVNHIKVIDRKYVPFLQGKGVK